MHSENAYITYFGNALFSLISSFHPPIFQVTKYNFPALLPALILPGLVPTSTLHSVHKHTC